MPTASSSFFKAIVIDDWDTAQRFADWEICPVSATDTKYSIWRRVMDVLTGGNLDGPGSAATALPRRPERGIGSSLAILMKYISAHQKYEFAMTEPAS
ncbi:hypothetical protein ACS0Y3_29335 [Burkholderia gladioli]|uniref:hypothetical protein n=1 Tax=Burkholderia gladioli TaxID=28095 RepID=UPI003F79948F